MVRLIAVNRTAETVEPTGAAAPVFPVAMILCTSGRRCGNCGSVVEPELMAVHPCQGEMKEWDLPKSAEKPHA